MNYFAYPCIMFLLSTIVQANLYQQTIFSLVVPRQFIVTKLPIYPI